MTGGWLKLQCPGVIGWIRDDLVEVSGSLATVPLETGPTPTPIPSPTPLAGVWRVPGYANRDLIAPPAATFETSEINYDWGTGAPSPVLPADNFSMRFDRTLRFTPGSYLFALTYDDGARLYVGNQLVINDWAEGAARTRTWQGTLSGDVAVRVDYFDAYGPAAVRLAVTPLQGVIATSTPLPPVLPAQPPDNAWLATYFNATTPQGPPVFARTEPAGSIYPLDYDFGPGSPVPGVINVGRLVGALAGAFPLRYRRLPL